jgi:hypothetical protein
MYDFWPRVHYKPKTCIALITLKGVWAAPRWVLASPDTSCLGKWALMEIKEANSTFVFSLQ